jgi:hypothetical protein
MKNGTRKKIGPSAKPTEHAVLRRQIEIRAYEIWELEGGCHGKELEHWLQAEREQEASNLSATS